MSAQPHKKRIVVLGTGMGSMSAVWYLTRRPDWAAHYDIDVYEMSWRMGGKGASGRDESGANRIFEHGLHMMFGFYDNALELLRALYDELGRSPGQPLATFDEAFQGHGVITLTDGDSKKKRKPWWVLPMPERGGEDADAPAGTLPHMVQLLLSYLRGALTGDGAALEKQLQGLTAGVLDGNGIVHDLEALIGRAVGLGFAGERMLGELFDTLHQSTETLLTLSPPASNTIGTHRGMVDIIEVLQEYAALGLKMSFRLWGDTTRRLLMLVCLGLAVLRGLLESFPNLWAPDWFAIDDLSIEDWLLKYDCPQSVVDSSLIKVLLQVGFARTDQAGAGTTLHWAMRMVLDYKGYFMYKMTAGMGDVIFAPFYQVLKERGVRFHFFHRVDALRHQGGSISQIEMGRPIVPKGDYHPLIDVNGLPCWPARPRFDQLQDGDKLKACWDRHPTATDLENWWTSWEDQGAPVRLQRGEDFDFCILGISVGALGEVCKDLCEDPNNPAFGEMVQATKTTQTRSLQLWLKETTQQLGFIEGTRLDSNGFSPVLGTYPEPFDTWSDMSQVIPQETWPDDEVKSIAYWCSSLPDTETPPPRGPNLYLQRQLARCAVDVMDWAGYQVLPVWPDAVTDTVVARDYEDAAARNDDPTVQTPRGAPKHPLNLSLLAVPPQPPAPGPGTCISEPPPVPDDDALLKLSNGTLTTLRSQYWRVPYNPSERYVLNVPGSVHKRLAAWQSGYDNLFLVGDWTFTPTSAGCIEATVQSGAMCAQALIGEPATFHDNWIFLRPPPPAIWLPPATPAEEANLIPDVVNPLPAPPYVAHKATLQAFVLDADVGMLRDICDRMLNLSGPNDGRVFQPLGGLVLFVAADIQTFLTAQPEATSPEKDFGFWIPVVQGRMEDGVFQAEAFSFFLPALWVDPALALTAGREIFGYRKSMGQLSQPLTSGDPQQWQINGYVAPAFGSPNAREDDDVAQIGYRWAPVVTVTSGTDEREWERLLTDGVVGLELLAELWAWLDGKIDIELSFWEQLIKELGGLQFPMVYLKQFASISNAQKACYQAICWAQNNVISGLTIDRLPGPFTLRNYPYASCDVAAALGLSVNEDGEMTPLGAVNMHFDFSAEPGKVLYDVRAAASATFPRGTLPIRASHDATATRDWRTHQTFHQTNATAASAPPMEAQPTLQARGPMTERRDESEPEAHPSMLDEVAQRGKDLLKRGVTAVLDRILDEDKS